MLKNNCSEHEDGCIIEQILKCRFINRTDKEKYKIIKSGRPTPALHNFKSTTLVKDKCQNRTFKTTHYEKWNWLTGCPKLNKLFCWPCLLYVNKATKRNKKWVDKGFCDMKHLSATVIKHERTQIHLLAVIYCQNYSMEHMQRDTIINEQKRILTNTHNADVKKNRLLLKRFIDAMCYLGMQGLEYNDSAENYIEIMDLIRKYDVPLTQYSMEFSLFQTISKDDLIASVAYGIHKEIINEIKQAPFIAIILDVSHKSKLSTKFRMVLKTGEVTERFYKLFDIGKDKSSETIANHVIDLVNVLGCGQTFIAQCYDDTSIMSGSVNESHAKVIEKFPHAKHVYTSDLVLSKSMNSIAECKVFFSTLAAISSFFKNSKKRIDALNNIIIERNPENSFKIWNFDSDVVCLVYSYRDSLNELFETIISQPKKWHALSIMSARSFIHFFKSILMQFLFKIFNRIYEYIDVLYDVLQNMKFDISYCITYIEETLKNIKEIRNRYDEFYNETIASTSLPRKKQRFNDENIMKEIFHKIVDTTLLQLDLRYDYYKELLFIDLLNSKKFTLYKIKFPDNLLDSLKMYYSQYFDIPKLINELTVIYKTNSFRKFSIEKFIEYLITTNLKSTFGELYNLSALILTLPIGTVSCLTTNQMKSTTNQNTVSDLTLIYREAKMLKHLQNTEEFYTNAITHFAEKTNWYEFIEM